jgi:hypothetical protein
VEGDMKVVEQDMTCMFPIGTVGEVTEILNNESGHAIKVSANDDYWYYAECELEVIL